MKFDLHTHTIYSDGIFSPKHLIELSLKRNLDGISITDHDNVDGLEEAVKFSNIIQDFKLIPGIEFSSNYNNEEIHILGYFINYKSKIIKDYSNQLKNARIKRSKEIVNKLNSLGLKIDFKNIELNNQYIISRTHIAKEMVKLNYVENINQAFDKYLKIGMPAYVAKKSLSTYDTINLIKDLDGLPVLAHPGLLQYEDTIDYCRNLGILGLECIHSKHSKDETNKFITYAKKYNLIITGGSDCHGELIQGDLLLGKYKCNIKKGDLLYDYL